MVSTIQSPQVGTWAKAILQPATEFGPVPLTVLSGSLPHGLQGTLYRNGPSRLERGGQRVEHWFDGDGGILGIRFNGQEAIATFRYVQTAGYQAEQQAGKFLFSGYGMLPSGPWWQRFSRGLKNAANTSVLALPDRLLALWEGGQPHSLTLDTLDTLGPDDLGGLNGGLYSAHPKRDPQTGDIFNFGVSIGITTQLKLYRSDRTGKIQQQNAIPLHGVPIIHDFVLAGRYLIFCIPPVRLQVLPVLAQLKSYSDALMWKPEQGTEIVVVDRETLEVVSRRHTAPWYQWHFGNGYEATDGSVVISIVRFPDFQTNQNLKEVATGKTSTPAKATLWELRLDPRSAKVLEMHEVLDRGCEFPTVKSDEVGQPWRYTYLAIHRQGVDTSRELFGAIARFDHQTATLTEANLGNHSYPSEPLYVPDAQDFDQGWILTVVYNGEGDCSEVWVFDAKRLDAEPVCRLALPYVVPIGFHGTWKR